MKTVLRDMGIIVVFACFVLLLALFYKGKYVQAENKMRQRQKHLH